MDYTMEDTQNSAPDALEASKLNPSGQRNETQSVTKRFVYPQLCFRWRIHCTNSFSLHLACRLS
jgi:hypothetical protein